MLYFCPCTHKYWFYLHFAVQIDKLTDWYFMLFLGKFWIITSVLSSRELFVSAIFYAFLSRIFDEKWYNIYFLSLIIFHHDFNFSNVPQRCTNISSQFLIYLLTIKENFKREFPFEIFWKECIQLIADYIGNGNFPLLFSNASNYNF